MSEPFQEFIPIDEQGYPIFGDIRISDSEVGREILRNLSYLENGALGSSVYGKSVIIEAFDEPIVVQMVDLESPVPTIIGLFDFTSKFELSSLSLDEWDRFHGKTVNGIPFVLSRKAQAKLFECCSEFGDDFLEIHNTRYDIPNWLPNTDEVESSEYWSQIYRTEIPRWELGKATPILEDMLPRLKLPKSKILILGCGTGNDAAFFAENGHVVTAVDVSQEALTSAKSKYSKYSDIKWLHMDLFKMGPEFWGQYDIVFEHTCFCAINPANRNLMVKQWSRLLAPGGHLMAVLFVMDQKTKPPFGGTEWEYRERLKNSFNFLFWGRWKQSVERRVGKELFIYAKKK